MLEHDTLNMNAQELKEAWKATSRSRYAHLNASHKQIDFFNFYKTWHLIKGKRGYDYVHIIHFIISFRTRLKLFLYSQIEMDFLALYGTPKHDILDGVVINEFCDVMLEKILLKALCENKEIFEKLNILNILRMANDSSISASKISIVFQFIRSYLSPLFSCLRFFACIRVLLHAPLAETDIASFQRSDQTQVYNFRESTRLHSYLCHSFWLWRGAKGGGSPTKFDSTATNHDRWLTWEYCWNSYWFRQHNIRSQNVCSGNWYMYQSLLRFEHIIDYPKSCAFFRDFIQMYFYGERLSTKTTGNVTARKLIDKLSKNNI